MCSSKATYNHFCEFLGGREALAGVYSCLGSGQTFSRKINKYNIRSKLLDSITCSNLLLNFLLFCQEIILYITLRNLLYSVTFKGGLQKYF